jgi:hypothetical protein
MSLFAIALAGCQLTSDIAYTSPSHAEQNRAVLEIVHNGMTRQQAVDALTREGVQGSFGVSESIYYCDAWDRGDSHHWYLDVALFFDLSGRLYKVGSSQLDSGSATDTSPSHAELSGNARPDDGTAFR